MLQTHRRRSRSESGARSLVARLGWPLILLLVTALVLGGGGISRGLQNGSVQLLALGLLLFVPGVLPGRARALPWPLLALVGVTFLLPLVQLVPLPASLWQTLPGRALTQESFRIIEQENGWFQLSVDRGRTIVAALALLGPAAALFLYRGAGRRDIAAGLALLVGLALLNFVFGSIQFAADGPYPYGNSSEKRFFGFFASHNTSGIFMIIGLLALIGYDRISEASAGRRLLHLLAGFLLVFAIVLTRSRSSTALLLVPIVFFAWYAIGDLRRATRKTQLIAAAAVTVLGAGIATVALTNDRLGETWARYEDLEDSRPAIWEDTRFAIERYWPVGSGSGTFDEVFQVEESLEALGVPRAGRAHSEYLELALEAGIAGLALLAAWALYLAASWWRRRALPYTPGINAAGLGLLCIAAQGVIDFPMRNMAVLTVAGLLVALLTAPRSLKRDPSIA